VHVFQGGWLLLTNRTTNEPHNTCSLYMSAHTWGRNHKPYKQSCKREEVGQFHWQQELGTNHRSNQFHCEHYIKKTQNKNHFVTRDGPNI
jgi:hypothetical protein